ncbi:DUF6327 family protein [Ulvibacterium marinum]|uniref:DUF6327 family protein n=1 Tax=Ulvibacterium marinum TaxID=2419782 RepID=UPI001B860940|nr:DUF6327 family protein [Ulvibacterium marinum]
MAKQYSSFSEIDYHLRILSLQREIDRESIKLRFNQVKSNFYPTQLVGGLSGTLKKILLTLAIKKLSLLFRGTRSAIPNKQMTGSDSG